MEKPLKSANAPGLVAAVTLNLFWFIAFQEGSIASAESWPSIQQVLARAVLAGIAVVLIFVINGLIPANAKARIVFLRWDNPLPGSEAFSRYLFTDPRISIDNIEREYGELPTSAREQNALWYRMYRGIASEPSVAHAHRAYLFTRDYAAIALMLFVVLGFLAIVRFPDSSSILIYLGTMTIQLVIVILAARNYGERFVTTVLAITSAME